MLGIVLTFIGTLFDEISGSIGKSQEIKNKENLNSMAFLNLFWASVFFLIISIAKTDSFVFDMRSIPTFCVRSILEIFQLYISLLAFIKADRSTFAFIRTITIPSLLVVDISLGYGIDLEQMAGLTLIIFALLFMFSRHEIEKKGAGLVALSAINAVITTSLFKYDITHYNSVVAEQLIIIVILLFFSTLVIVLKEKRNPLTLFNNSVFSIQSILSGIGRIAEGYAFNYGIASVLMAAKRTSSILLSIISGNIYFKEKHPGTKILIFTLLSFGIILLALGSTPT